MKIIESTKNDWIKQLKKLEKKKYRDSENKYIIEGEHLVEEAILNKAAIETILVTESSQVVYKELLNEVSREKLTQVTDEIIKHLSSLPSPQPIMAVISKDSIENKETKTQHLLLLDNVQDPGNVGTMIRTADAAGFSGVLLGEGTADIYNSKVLRSMQGSQFHINLEEVELKEKIISLKEDGYTIYSTELNEKAISYKEITQTDKMAIIMGNEGQGVSEELLQLSDVNVFIPMKGQAESLNVAVAAGIMMFFI